MTLTNDQLDAISSDQVAALKDNVNWVIAAYNDSTVS